jgi:hypothetical protein
MLYQLRSLSLALRGVAADASGSVRLAVLVQWFALEIYYSHSPSLACVVTVGKTFKRTFLIRYVTGSFFIPRQHMGAHGSNGPDSAAERSIDFPYDELDEGLRGTVISAMSVRPACNLVALAAKPPVW